MGTCVVTVFIVLVMVSKSELIANDEECDLLQYLTIGRNGTIQCSFSEFHAVSWFDIEEDRTVLFYEKGVEPEDGYVSDDYDLYPNGSLFIRNVTLEHETLFRVKKVISVSKPTVFYEIRVRIIVPPPVPHPVIEQCQDNLTVCYAIQEDSSALSCFVQNVRPRVSLVWNQREADRDTALSSEHTTESRNNETFSSRSTVQISTKFPLLSVFVCSAEENAWLLEENETVVVLENGGSDRISKTRKQYVELHTTMLLPCTTSEANIIVWKRMVDTETTVEVILLRVKTWKNDFNETYNDDFRLTSDGSLLLRNTEWHHQGRYTCLVDEYTPEELHIDVIIFVMPVPIYLKVAECDIQDNCVLKVNQSDVLTCSVHGIRPEVNLEWRVYEPNTKVSFSQENHTVHPNGDNYDIILTSTITFTPAAENKVKVECRVVGTNANIFNLSQTIDLLIPNVQANSNYTGVLAAVITVAIIVLVIVILMIGGIILRKVHSNHSPAGSNLYQAIPMVPLTTAPSSCIDQDMTVPSPAGSNLDQAIPMVPPTTAPSSCIDQDMTDENQEKDLIDQLKRKYKILYDAVQPIPYIKDRMYCVDKVFVEGGIDYLDKTTVPDEWTQMNSYNELIDGIRIRSTRKILEGEPGYGKSTLTLQLVYDWCQGVPNSPLKEVKILILLRLRQLGGVNSIFEAVRRFILAKDSTFTVDEVESVIRKCSSVMLVLDGYDEYPDQDETNSDVYKILKNDIFREITVILTTRSSYLPNYLTTQTDRARLTGFDDLARDKYIRKAVTGDNNEAVDKIKQKLKENPVLEDLCEVPLFFVMSAHMTHENKMLQIFNSVTCFFGKMISCFHSHMRNKIKDDNVTTFNQNELEHFELDKIAFNALSGKDKKIVWQKEFLCKALGEDFYNQYVRIGILVEEEVRDMFSLPDSTGEMRSTVEVRFYHKLFCEWYAAYHLTNTLSKQESDTLALLANLDPSDVQYLFRFACGINKDAAQKIIKHLQGSNKGQNVAMLCILEQEGERNKPLESITKLVSNGVTVNASDTKLLQRSITQILEFALKKEIPISSLTLNNSFSKIDSGSILLHSGIRLSCPVSVMKTVIHAKTLGKEMTEKDVVDILKFVQQSHMLEELKFDQCRLPTSFSSEAFTNKMKTRKIQVRWCPFDIDFYLNLDTGHWEVDNIDTLRQLCSNIVHIKKSDDILKQASTIMFIHIASSQKIPISCLYLQDSFSNIDNGDVILNSELRLSCPVSVKKVVINTERRREMTETEFVDILKFVQQSNMLEELKFEQCRLPTSFSSDAFTDIMETPQIQVRWCPFDIDFYLDLDTGHWEVDNIDTLRQLCSDTVYIKKSDDIVKQTSTIMFIPKASSQKIPISCLYLQGSFSNIDDGDVILHSGLRLSCPVSVKKVVINTEEEGREMTETEVVDILMFVQQSHLLEELEFTWCLLPHSISAESIPPILKSKNVKVTWFINLNTFELNLQSGRWLRMHTEHEIKDEGYNDTVRWYWDKYSRPT